MPLPVWADSYTPPWFDLEDNREFLDDMDPVLAFINHNAGRYSDCTGGPQPVSNIFQAYLSETKDRAMTLPRFLKEGQQERALENFAGHVGGEPWTIPNSPKRVIYPRSPRNIHS